MADQEFDVDRRAFPRDDDDGERRIHAPGGSVVVTAMMGGGGGDRDREERRERDRPVPATLPLDGSETVELHQAGGFRPWWRRVYISLLDFIRQFWPAAWTWSGLSLKADQPLTPLFTVPPRDMVYQLVYSIACKIADAGASMGTLSLFFTPLDGTTNPETATCNLAISGNGSTHSVAVLLQGGSAVSFKFVGGGVYGAATYDIIVSAIPLCSDNPVNRSDNLLL